MIIKSAQSFSLIFRSLDPSATDAIKKGRFFTKQTPSFSDTWQRSRRETWWKMIVRTFRIFLDLSKSSEIKKIRSLLRYMVGIWSKFGQGRKLVKKVKIWKVLRMGLPIVENLSGLQESIFSLSRRPQLHFGKKSKKKNRIILNLSIFPYSPCLGSLGLLSFVYSFILIFRISYVFYIHPCDWPLFWPLDWSQGLQGQLLYGELSGVSLEHWFAILSSW